MEIIHAHWRIVKMAVENCNTVLIDKTHNTPYNMVSKTIMVIVVILWR